MDTRLSGQVVIVTGASGGIGAAICRGFAAEGARVVIHYRTGHTAAASLRRELKGSETIALRADLRDPRRAPKLTVTREGDSLCQKVCYPMALCFLFLLFVFVSSCGVR
jgi:NAD(P)-dependent dehydrogenase (short-subunit alcohol dehydrogenase family)